MTRKEYEQRLEALEREIAALKLENVEDGVTPEPPHPRWRPAYGEKYYFINRNANISSFLWDGGYPDTEIFAFGNVYKSIDAAEYAAEYYKVLAEMREWAGKWNDPWIIIYDSFKVEAIPIYGKDVTFGELRFASEKDAENCIKAVGKDRMIKYYFGVRDHEIPAETE